VGVVAMVLEEENTHLIMLVGHAQHHPVYLSLVVVVEHLLFVTLAHLVISTVA
jgi:hypothetical protein